jgi:hypothetical protein
MDLLKVGKEWREKKEAASRLGVNQLYVEAHTLELFTICSEVYWLAGFGRVWPHPYPP